MTFFTYKNSDEDYQILRVPPKRHRFRKVRVVHEPRQEIAEETYFYDHGGLEDKEDINSHVDTVLQHNVLFGFITYSLGTQRTLLIHKVLYVYTVHVTDLVYAVSHSLLKNTMRSLKRTYSLVLNIHARTHSNTHIHTHPHCVNKTPSRAR